MAERKLDPRGPNKFEPEKHELFPGQKNYPEKPGRKVNTPTSKPKKDKK